jgi:ribonucleotide reductase alpha subunit
MIDTVIKRDGSTEPFMADKLNKWAEYAGAENWSTIAINTFKKLTNPAKTEDIHQAMIDSCVQMKDLAYSRMAARLEVGAVRKNMDYILGVNDNSPLEDIIEVLEDYGVWCSDTIPPYNPKWQKVYDKMRKEPLEYWQIKQWNDKYACKIEENVIETPFLGYIGISLALFGDTKKAYEFAEALAKGKINLPTPALNGLRNGDWDTISCCLISGGDTVDSIGIADHIAYRMTSKKAGIGIEYTTRSINDKVKGGRVKHLGKQPIFARTDKTVKTMTQITRGGNATVMVYACDPEIEKIISLKSQKIDIEQRLDKLDYNFGYNAAFVKAAKQDLDWYLFSIADAPDLLNGPCHYFYLNDDDYLAYVDTLVAKGVKHTKVKARDLLKKFLTVRQESGRFYDSNLTTVNRHTPFVAPIRQNNLCVEICLPTSPFMTLEDFVSDDPSGEVAFCSLSAINYHKTKLSELERIAELTLEAIDIMIERAPMITKGMKKDIMRRRSVAVGITGLASLMYQSGFDYDGSQESIDFVRNIAEHHYYYLLKASQKLAKRDKTHVDGIKVDWLPIDTAKGKSVSGLDWEALRGLPRKHSVLVAHMPTESSALLSGSSNGKYPVRSKVVTKQSRKGYVQFICEEFVEGKHLTAWEVDNINLSRYYSAIQDNTDQAISADFYVVPDNFPQGKVPMSKLMREFFAHSDLGNKTRYYNNTKDSNGGSVQQQIACSEGTIYPAIALDPHGTGQSTLADLSALGIDFEALSDEGCEGCKL